jgi:mannose-6-phosphate isomerase-like protein (cupin superfamily)
VSTSATAYTHENLTAIEDSAPKFGFEGIQEARFASDELDAADTGVSYHRVMPGHRQAFAHRHDTAEEVYVVLAGTGRMKLDDDIIDVKPLDAIRVAPTVTRQFEAGREQLEFLAVGARHRGDGEIVQEWWTD